MHKLSRRNSITQTAAATMLAAPCCIGLLRESEALAHTETNYYLLHATELTKTFQETLAGAYQFWAPEFGDAKAGQMTQQAMALFETLLPNLPDVGGDKNWDTRFLPVAAWYVALYKPMRENGKRAEDVGKLVYELNLIALKSITKEKAAAEQEKFFSREHLDRMQKWADWTQKREYPSNWVARFIPGDGKEFDFGYDYSECALVKYLRTQGVPELAPYVCLNDFTSSASLGSGLNRTKTIAQGDPVCNFRYKKNRPVVKNWTTEISLIRSRMPE